MALPNRKDHITSLLRDVARGGVLPVGALSKVSREIGVSREYVRQVAAREGFLPPHSQPLSQRQRARAEHVHVPALASPELVLAANVKRRRLRKGLTQEGLALRAGVSVDTVRRTERAVRVPTPAMQEAMAAALGVTAATLMRP